MRRRERDRPLAAMPLRIAACIAAMSAAIIGVDAGVTAPALVTNTNTFDFTITPDWTDGNVVTAMRWGLGTSAGAVDAQGLREIADVDAAKTGRTVNGTVEYKATFNSSVTRLALVPGTGYYVVVEADYTPAGGAATKKNASSVKIIADDTPPALVTLIPNFACDVNGVMTVDEATPKPEQVSLLHARLPNSQASRTNNAEAAALINNAAADGEDLSAKWGLELCWKFDEGESWVTDYSFAIFTSPLSYYDPSVAVSNATGGVSRGRRLLAATTANVYRTFGQTASTQASVRTTSQLSPWKSLGSNATRLKTSQRDMIDAMRTNPVDADAGVEINGYVAVHIRATNAAGLITEVSGPEILIPPEPPSGTAEGDSLIYGIIAGVVVVFAGVLFAFYREMRRQDKTAKEKERQQLLEDGSRQMNLVLRALASDRDDDSLLKRSDSSSGGDSGVASGRRSRRGSVGSEDLDLGSVEEHRSGSEDWRGRDGGGIHRRRNVVFVCTDMEGSTAMAAENAELYQEVQDKHDEVLSSAALAHNGYIFATQGDAFELVFPTIGDAVRFCLEGQEALLRTQWSSVALDLPKCGAHESKPGERAPFEFAGPRVRMGIHAASLASRGDGVDEEDPHDLGAWDLQEFTRTFDKDHGRVKYDGPAVVMTRVIGDSAAGGQIVLSETAVAEFERQRASCDFAVLSDLGKFQFTELTAGTLGSRTGAAGKGRKQQPLDDDDGTAGDARSGHRGRGKDKHVVSRLHELQPPTFSYMPLREFPPMLRGTVKLDVGLGLDFPKKPSIRAASRRGDTVVMARVHGIRPSKWAEIWLTSNFQQVMDRHVCALLQLFGGVPLREDADIPSHTYALCFPAASAAVRFSMALQVSLLYGTWDNDVLENSVRPHYSRSGQLLARGPTVACMVITLDENDGDDIGDMCRQMDYYDERGVPEKGNLGLRMTDPPAPPPFAPPSVPNALRGSLHAKGHHAGDSEANHSGRGFGTGAANESSAASDDSSTIGGGNIDSSAGGVARSASSVTGGGLGNRFLAALGVSLGTQKSSWSSSSDDQTKTLRHVFAPGDPVRYSNFSDAAKLPRFETLMRTIYPGQVSVTADTWLSVQHALPEGVSPVDLGAHKLRCKTVMVEPCNGVRFDSNSGGGIMDSLDGGSGDEGGTGAARRTASMSLASSHEIRVDFADSDSDGAGDTNRNAEYDVSLYNVSHRILHERAYPPLRSVRCSSPGYYDSPRPADGVAIVFCKPRLPKNLNSGAAEEAKQRWASIARALLPVYSGYECKSPETGQFTLAFTRLENAIGFCTNAQAMMSQFAARDDSGGWPKELLDAEAKEAADAEAAVRKEREEAKAQGLKKVNFVTDTAQLAAHRAGQRGLRVAMGIAYGVNCFRKPLLETGRADYFGPLANLAARVMSCAHGGQVLVEGVPLLWKDKERFRGSVHWFPNDPTDADSLKEREQWCERSKTAVNTMMGTFNVPWFLVVNAGKAATQMLLKELDAARRSRDAEEERGGTLAGSSNRPSIERSAGSAGEPALHLLHNLRATLEQKSERDIGAWIRQGGVGGLDMETGASESALALCARGFCELRGFPQITPLVEARSPSLKPAKFPAIRTQRDPVSYEKLAGPRPPRAWEATANATSSMDRSSKYYGGGAGSKLASIVLGMTSSGPSRSVRGGRKGGSKWNVVRDAVEGSDKSGRGGSKFTRRLLAGDDKGASGDASIGARDSPMHTSKDSNESDDDDADGRNDDSATPSGASEEGSFRSGNRFGQRASYYGRGGGRGGAGESGRRDGSGAGERAAGGSREQKLHAPTPLSSAAAAAREMFAAQYDDDDDDDGDDDGDGYVRARSPAIRHEPRVDAKPVASALRRVGSKADLATGTNAGGGGGGGGGGDSASEPSTSRGNSVRGATSAADLVQGARQTSFGSLPVYKPGVQVERMPRLDRIDSTTSAETTDTSPRSTSEEGSRRASRDGGAVRKRGGRSRSSSSSAMQHSDDVVTDDAYQYKSRRGEVFKRLLDVIGTAQCSPAARSRLWDAVKVLSRIVEDVKTLDADASDDDMRHHLDRLQRAINREYNSGQVPVVFCLVLMCFEHCSAARQVKMHTARAQYLMESMRRKGSTTSQGSSLSSESGRPRSSRHSSGGRSGSGRSSDASSERAKSNRTNRGPNEIAVDRAQLSAVELAEEIARERDAARAPSSGAEGAVRDPDADPDSLSAHSGSTLSERPPSATGIVVDDEDGGQPGPFDIEDPSSPAADGSVVVEDESADESDESPDEDELERAAIVAGAPAECDITSVVAIAASVGHQHEPLDYGPKASETLRLRAHTWRDFDLFAFADDIGPERCGERGGGPLMALGVAILDRHGVFERLGVERDSCAAFLAGLHCLYMRRGGIYHGPMHAADVLQAAGVLLDELHPHSLPEGATPETREAEPGAGPAGGDGDGGTGTGAGTGRRRARLDDLQAFALVIGAAIHDVYHPGVTNAFRAAQDDDQARRFGGVSVNENEHLSIALALLANPATDAAAGLGDAQRARLTRMLRHGVLHTDMANHAALMRDFRECAAAAREDPNHPWWSDEDATRAMGADGYPHKTQDSLVSAVLHLADISNTARPAPLFHAWAKMLQHEFQAQGKREELLGMPVTPMCASPPSNLGERAGLLHAAKSLATAQIGFVNMFVVPMVTELVDASVAPDTLREWRCSIARNVAWWEKRKAMKSLPKGEVG